MDMLENLMCQLPASIQHGNRLCHLKITKFRDTFIFTYTNAKKDFWFAGKDVTAVAREMLDKLNSPASNEKYLIKWNSFID